MSNSLMYDDAFIYRTYESSSEYRRRNALSSEGEIIWSQNYQRDLTASQMLRLTASRSAKILRPRRGMLFFVQRKKIYAAALKRCRGRI
jgi:hypothetical protein